MPSTTLLSIPLPSRNGFLPLHPTPHSNRSACWVLGSEKRIKHRFIPKKFSLVDAPDILMQVDKKGSYCLSYVWKTGRTSWGRWQLSCIFKNQRRLQVTGGPCGLQKYGRRRAEFRRLGGQRRKENKLYVQRAHQRAQSQITVPLLSPIASHVLFQTPHEAAIRTAFLVQLTHSQGHQIQLTNANRAF